MGPFPWVTRSLSLRHGFTPEVIMPRVHFKCPVSHFCIDKCSVSIQLLASLQNVAPVPHLSSMHPFYKYFQNVYELLDAGAVASKTPS